MNFKDKLNQIKALLSMEVKLEQMKLNDGTTVVEAESFEPDYSIGIVTETGIVPLPVGSYTTEDGKTITVEQEGVIASVTDAAAETETETEVEVETPEEVTAPEMEVQQPKRVVESVSKETFFSMQEELSAVKAELEALKIQLSAQEQPVELSADVPTPLTFNPENETKIEVKMMATKRAKTTYDLVTEKLFKNAN